MSDRIEEEFKVSQSKIPSVDMPDDVRNTVLTSKGLFISQPNKGPRPKNIALCFPRFHVPAREQFCEAFILTEHRVQYTLQIHWRQDHVEGLQYGRETFVLDLRCCLMIA